MMKTTPLNIKYNRKNKFNKIRKQYNKLQQNCLILVQLFFLQNYT